LALAVVVRADAGPDGVATSSGVAIGLAARFDDIVARAPDWPIDAAALAVVAVALV
jgi:hypothetical protein